MKEVEIHPAHVWTCDECGRDNFERGVQADFLTPQEYRDICEEMGVFDPAIQDEPPVGMLMTAPQEVTCRYCGETFRTAEIR